MTNKNYKSASAIRNMGAAGKDPLVKMEYTNYDEYLLAQKQVHDHFFSLPAKNCELCGYPMDYNNHILSEREFKWSVHDVCKKKMDTMLDRETGIHRERKALERQAERQKKRGR